MQVFEYHIELITRTAHLSLSVHPRPPLLFCFCFDTFLLPSFFCRRGSRSEPPTTRTAHHLNRGSLELRGELRAEAADEIDGLAVGHEGPAGRVQVGAEVGRATHVLLHRGGGGVGGIHLSAEGPELGEGDVAGAARGGRVCSRSRVGGHERGGALGGEVRGLGEKGWG